MSEKAPRFPNVRFVVKPPPVAPPPPPERPVWCRRCGKRVWPSWLVYCSTKCEVAHERMVVNVARTLRRRREDPTWGDRRNDEIIRQRDRGMTHAAIAAHHEISVTRVTQIIRKDIVRRWRAAQLELQRAVAMVELAAPHLCHWEDV